MKALIWIGCFFVYTFLNEILGLAIGFRLGYIFTLIIPFAVAKKLCSKWDAHIIREKAKKRGITPFEFFKAELPPIVINGCEASRGDKEALKQFLKRRLERSEVSKGQVIILMEEYMKPKTSEHSRSVNENARKVVGDGEKSSSGAVDEVKKIVTDKIVETPQNKPETTVQKKPLPVKNAFEITKKVRFCYNCGDKLIEGSNFCRKCGARIIEKIQ